MQGLGEIIRANIAVGNQAVKQRSGPGSVGRNGEGSPWNVRHGTEPRSDGLAPDFVADVVCVADGAVLGSYPTIREARKHIARLIHEAGPKWPARADGRPKSLGEMNPAQRVAQLATSVKRVTVEFRNPRTQAKTARMLTVGG